MTPTSATASLFDQVLEVLGLASMIGPGVVQRSLKEESVLSPAQARPNDYLKIIPRLRVRLAVYLPPEEVASRLARLNDLLVKSLV